MKLVLLISLLYAVSLAAQTYDNLEKVGGIEIKSYGSQASKDIRAIGRSYAFQLTKKQDFTTYVDDVHEIFTKKSVETVTKAQTYSKKYTVHVAVVGIGIILAIFLGIGFCFSPCCMCCCNRSQKQTSTMPMWRMIWGTILIVLLAANVAGILILVVSGVQMLSLEGDTSDTIDTLADGFVNYLEGTDKQIESLKTNQLVQFIGALDPLIDNAITAAVSTIKGNTNLATHVTNVVGALNTLDTKLDEATTNINEVQSDVTALTATLTAINTNLGTCQQSFIDCDTGGHDCSGTTGVDQSKFDTSFNPTTLDSSGIDTIITKIGEMKTFGTPPARTLAQWATYVEDQWNDILSTVNGKTATQRQDYKDKLALAKADFSKEMEDTVQKQIETIKEQIETNKDKTKKGVTATLKYINNLMMLKEGDTEDVPETVTQFGSEPIGKYVIFAVFVFICVLLGLLVLTVLVGLLSTIFGCCKVDDEVCPTERSSGTCGTLLMCTSYCSVLLCAIATFVAALLVSVVMAQEGLCKQYNDDKLIAGLKTMSTTFNMPDLDLGTTITEYLKLDSTVDMEKLLGNCKDNFTVFAAFDVKKDTKIMDFSIQDVEKKVNDQIDSFDTKTIGSLEIDLNLMDADSEQALVDNKDALNTYDYSDIKDKLDNTATTSIGDLAQLSTDVGGLAVATGNLYNLAGCKTAIDTIITEVGNVDTQKLALKGTLTTMQTTANAAIEEVTNFITALTGIDAIVTKEYISKIVEDEVKAVISTAKIEVTSFVNYLFDQFLTTIGNCQPIAAVYYTAFNYTCDNIFVHLTLLYCGLSLIGISLLFYMCVSRCMARYFIKFGSIYPGDESAGNGIVSDITCNTNNSHPPRGGGARHPRGTARSGKRTLFISSPRVQVGEPSPQCSTSPPHTTPSSPPRYHTLHTPDDTIPPVTPVNHTILPVTPLNRANVLPPLVLDKSF